MFTGCSGASGTVTEVLPGAAAGAVGVRLGGGPGSRGPVLINSEDGGGGGGAADGGAAYPPPPFTGRLSDEDGVAGVARGPVVEAASLLPDPPAEGSGYG